MRFSQIIISALLIVVCLFGLVASGLGVKDAMDIADYKTTEKENGLEAIDMLDGGISQLRDNEQTYLNGVQAYAAGLNTYYAGKDMYDNGVIEYNQGVQMLEDNKQAYEDGLVKLDQTKHIYNLAKWVTTGYNKLPIKLPIGKAIMGFVEKKIVNPYEDGKAQIQQYEDGKAAIEAAGPMLAQAKTQLAYGVADLGSGHSALAVYENGENSIAAGINTLMQVMGPIYRHDDETVAVKGLQDRVGGRSYTCYALDKNGNVVVKNGTNFLNLDACQAVADAGREYIQDQTDDVKAEVLGRVILCALTALASLFGLIAGIAGIIGSEKAPLSLGIISLIFAVIAIVAGIFTRFAGYTYPLENGDYAGGLQFAMSLVLLLAAIAFVAVAAVVKSSEDKRRAAAAAASTETESDRLSKRLDALENENINLRKKIEDMTATHIDDDD